MSPGLAAALHPHQQLFKRPQRPQRPQRQQRNFLSAAAVAASGGSGDRRRPSRRMRIAVIGGGASGIFGAIAAAESVQQKARGGVEVVVLEASSKLLQKVKISGGGRCNVMHDDRTKPSLRDMILLGYPRGNRELHGLFSKSSSSSKSKKKKTKEPRLAFGPPQARDWFEQRGVELKTEADGRMFPTTDSSQTIIDTLLFTAEQACVRIQTRSAVQSIQVIPPPDHLNKNDNDIESKDDESTNNCDSEKNPTSQRTKFQIVLKDKSADENSSPPLLGGSNMLVCDAVLIATGSIPLGYKLAQSVGHSIVKPVPSLFTLSCKHDVKEGAFNDEDATKGLLFGLSGLSVPNARIRYQAPAVAAAAQSTSPATITKQPQKSKGTILEQEGPLLITHHGLSGPAALRLSAFGARELNAHNYRGQLKVHWAPSLGTTQDVFDELWESKTTHPKRGVASVCPLFVTLEAEENSLISNQNGESEVEFLDDDDMKSPLATSTFETSLVSKTAIPKRLWAAMTLKAGISKDTTWAEASKKQVRQLATLVAECPFELTSKGTFKEEFVTAGGVDLKELDMKTMSSKLQNGLYFCGELINVDGVTGGYNFMNCWSTGFIAGVSAANYVLDLQ